MRQGGLGWAASTRTGPNDTRRVIYAISKCTCSVYCMYSWTKSGLWPSRSKPTFRPGFLYFQKIYEPVAVPVGPKKGKKPDRTGPSNTNFYRQFIHHFSKL